MRRALAGIDILLILASLDFLAGVCIGLGAGVLGYKLGLLLAKAVEKTPLPWAKNQARKSPQRLRLMVALAGIAILMRAPYSLVPRLQVGMGIGAILAAGLLINPPREPQPSSGT